MLKPMAEVLHKLPTSTGQLPKEDSHQTTLWGSSLSGNSHLWQLSLRTSPTKKWNSPGWELSKGKIIQGWNISRGGVVLRKSSGEGLSGNHCALLKVVSIPPGTSQNCWWDGKHLQALKYLHHVRRKGFTICLLNTKSKNNTPSNCRKSHMYLIIKFK